MVWLFTGRLIKINPLNLDVLFVPEAAVRSQKQAESEDFNQVDIEHFEKILPQLVCHRSRNRIAFKLLHCKVLC